MAVTWRSARRSLVTPRRQARSGCGIRGRAGIEWSFRPRWAECAPWRLRLTITPSSPRLARACSCGTSVSVAAHEDKAPSLSGGSADEAGNGHVAHAQLPTTPKQTNRSTTLAENLLLLAITAMFAVCLLIAFVWWWSALWLVYRSREQCRWLLESWLERDGITLIHSQMIVIPLYHRLFYRVRVEDRRGRQFQGWAEVSGKFWSTPEFVPLRVDYYFTRRVAPRAKRPITADKSSRSGTSGSTANKTPDSRVKATRAARRLRLTINQGRVQRFHDGITLSHGKPRAPARPFRLGCRRDRRRRTTSVWGQRPLTRRRRGYKTLLLEVE